MRFYVAADIEGIAGVVSQCQTLQDGGVEYQRARNLMVREVNAAITSAFDSGATRLVVNDAHGPNTNIAIEDLDPRAELISGKPKPLNMVHGVDAGFDGLMFIGYHAKAGTADAILDHTYMSAIAYDIQVNGVSYGEFGLNAMLAGAFGVPAILISGDDKVIAEARELVPEIEAVVVKQAVSRTAAINLSPSAAQERIREGVARAIERLRTSPIEPFRPPRGTLTLEVSFLYSSQADTAALLPGSRRVGARTIGFENASYVELFRVCRALLLLGTAGS